MTAGRRLKTAVAPVASRRYKVGRQQIVRGDCLRVLARMAPETVDVIVTSPPYNIGLSYRSYPDRREEEDYLDWMMTVAEHLKRVLKPEGSFFLNISGSSAQPWLPFELVVRLRDLFVLQNHISWVKSISVGETSFGHFKPMNSQRFLHRGHENLFHFTQQGDVLIDRLSAGVPYQDKSNIARRGHQQDRRCRGDVWFIPYETVRGRSEKFDHPGTFPVGLPEQCIRLHGQKNASILDPFMGTGTTLVAAQRMGCAGVGIDIDDGYVTIARQRLMEDWLASKAP